MGKGQPGESLLVQETASGGAWAQGSIGQPRQKGVTVEQN